jgi:hypothetical protein
MLGSALEPTGSDGRRLHGSAEATGTGPAGEMTPGLKMK